MPIYEYRCDNCAHEFETIQKLSDEPLKTCPACSTDSLRKKVSAAGFRLKGGGWYETDFKGSRRKNVAGEEKAAKEGGDKGASNGSDGGSSDKSSEQKGAGTASKADEGTPAKSKSKSKSSE